MSKPHIFLFHGTDGYSIAQKVRLWKTEFDKKHGAENCAILDCETLGKDSDAHALLSQLMRSATLFSTTKLIIIKNLFGKSTSKNLLEAFTDEIEGTPPTHFLVFCGEAFDQRTAFSKKIKSLAEQERAQLSEFVTPRGRDLIAWIRQYLRDHSAQMESSALSEFAARFDAPPIAGLQKWQEEKPDWDLWAVTHELEKLIAYAQGRAIVIDDVQLLVRENADAHVFTLVDALCSQDAHRARQLASILVGDGADAKSSAIAMVALLASQFRQFVIIKELLSRGEKDAAIAEKLNWKPQRLWVVSKKIQRLSFDQLRAGYRALLDADAALKSSSADPLALFERVLAAV